MMNNLFSIFDPTSSLLNMQLNWVSLLIIMMLFYYNYWFFSSRFLKFLNILFLMSDMSILFCSIMMMVLVNNFMGLFPYIFTGTSHLLVTMSLALFLWVTYFVYGWFANAYKMLAHLVPVGTPMMLMPFMVVIETISNVIRPITLSVRLMANMTAGHLLISLMSSTCEKLSLGPILLIILLQMFLMILELAVAIIQAYVFATLVLLYYNEMN
uniref:ATP synthase subunit a n=1 Tax=Rhynchothorax sp. JZ-2022 TaxID=2992009 RepID=A0A9E8ADK0_9CHEL|nr:ATP synthase F0 subunit 6 [Rhynchothorax sp. JZ-2022]